MELFPVSHVARLLGQNGRCFPLVANVKKHEPPGKRFTRLRSASHRFDVDPPILVKAHKIQTAKSRSILVLPADGGFDAVQFNFAGRGRKLLGARRLTRAHVERMQKTDSKCAAGSHSSAGGNIREAGDFHAALDSPETLTIAYAWMFG